MDEALEFSALLRLMDERVGAIRDAVRAAPGLDVAVPTCPEWTLFELVRHVGEGRRAWAATVSAGPEVTAKIVPADAGDAPKELEALLDWVTESNGLLVNALREVGPDGFSWGWWRKSQSALTGAGVARRQLHEVAVHTYDAQLAAGVPQPIPAEVALDGVEEFLFTFGSTTEPWPYEPATVDLHATEGRSWRVTYSADGAKTERVADEGPGAASASARGTASDLVLMLYDRPSDAVEFEGDMDVFEQAGTWEPER